MFPDATRIPPSGPSGSVDSRFRLSGGGPKPQCRYSTSRASRCCAGNQKTINSTMSVTTTANARIATVTHLLADYELEHGQPTEEESAPAPPPNAQSPPLDGQVSNPADWQDQWRRVPAYRPVRHQLDEQRDTYANEIEHNFIRVMLGGKQSYSSALVRSC